MKNIYVVAFMLASFTANAAWFATSFEDCINDGKVGRTNAELEILKQTCRVKFPKLPSIQKGAGKAVSCAVKQDDFVSSMSVSVNKSKMKAKFGSTEVYVESFTDESVQLSVRTSKNDKEDFKFIINYLYGTAEMRFTQLKETAYIECNENK